METLASNDANTYQGLIEWKRQNQCSRAMLEESEKRSIAIDIINSVLENGDSFIEFLSDSELSDLGQYAEPLTDPFDEDWGETSPYEIFYGFFDGSDVAPDFEYVWKQ